MKKIITLILLFAISNSFAAIYYVSTTGLDTYNGTSITTPFLTVAKALSKATVPGDIIYVRSGTYVMSARLNITKSGTITNPITISAYPADVSSVFPNDGRPVFDFSSLTVGSSSQGIQAKNAAYWKIYGLKIKGAGDNGMLVDNCNNFKIEFCDFFRNKDAGFQIRNSSHHCLILNCDAYENADRGTGTTTNGGNADGFAPKLDLGDSITFRGCRAWLNSDDGWDGYLKAIESGVPDGMTTILENCWTWRNGYYWLDGSTTVDQNGNGFKMGGSANKDQAHHFVLVKCLSFYNKGKGFDQNNNAGSIFLYNCTANKNGDNDFGLNSSGVTYATGSQFIVKNCNSLGAKSTNFQTGTVRTNNNFSTATTITNYVSLDTTGVSGHRKIDGSLPDLNYMRLTANSILIDGGVALPTISYYDTLGIRFNGLSPDIGCFESNYPTPVKLKMYEVKTTSSSTTNRAQQITNIWTTAIEINTSHFNIQRSIDGTNFETIGSLSAKRAGNYRFTDQWNSTNSVSIIYYRLEIIDNDGSKTYSEVKQVRLNELVHQAISIYPNPAKDFIVVETKNAKELVILNQIGQAVQQINNVTGYQTIDIKQLANGLYFIKVIYNNGQVATSSFIR
jgi:hypothetical protein